MSDNPIMGMKEQQRRRARINRLKKTIIWTIVLWMLLSLIAIVILGLTCFSLNKRLNNIYDFLTSASGNVAKVESSIIDESFEGETLEEGDVTIEYNIDGVSADEKKLVYLTFDDGPSSNTDDILDILDKYGVRATFFVVGKTDEFSQEMYERIYEDGHTLGLHSYSHKYSSIYSSVESFEKDMNKLDSQLYEITGQHAKFIRFPGGSSNSVSSVDMKEFIEWSTEQGYVYFDWNVVSGDATSVHYTVDELISNVIDGVHKHDISVVLMHDATNKTSTVEALPKIIEQLQAEGYTLLSIDENTQYIQHVSVDTVVND